MMKLPSLHLPPFALIGWGLGLAAAFSACTNSGSDSGTPLPTPPGGQTGELATGCLPARTVALRADEVSELGYSAADVLAHVQGTHRLTLAWANGETTEGTLAVTFQGGDVEFRDNEWMDDGGGTREFIDAAATECLDDVSIDVDLAFDTDDGSLTERWSDTIRATDDRSARTYFEFDLTQLSGTFRIEQFAPSDAESSRMFLDLVLAAEGPAGELRGQSALSTDGSSELDAVAVAQFFEIGSVSPGSGDAE